MTTATHSVSLRLKPRKHSQLSPKRLGRALLGIDAALVCASVALAAHMRITADNDSSHGWRCLEGLYN
jgi:uncharacterized membrane protein